jgi:aminodeoxyfutalosine synthase
VDYYAQIVAAVREVLPRVHIKAFTAEEIWKMHTSAGMSVDEVLGLLRGVGLRSLAGGGAEILDDEVRSRICPHKVNSQQWLMVHAAAHRMHIKSNATMLYGHIETLEQRIVHLSKLRALQDETNGFNAFIPLKYRKYNACIPSVSAETTAEEDKRMMAVCRIYLDNIVHVKAYLPALGKDAAMSMLHCGADDMDGTIYDGTKIYAGQDAGISILELQDICAAAGFTLRERDSEYGYAPLYVPSQIFEPQ